MIGIIEPAVSLAGEDVEYIVALKLRLEVE